MSVDEIFKNHPKVHQARKLLREAGIESIAEHKRINSEMLCECGHKMNEHTPSYSINYTGGACYKCDCLNFLGG